MAVNRGVQYRSLNKLTLDWSNQFFAVLKYSLKWTTCCFLNFFDLETPLHPFNNREMAAEHELMRSSKNSEFKYWGTASWFTRSIRWTLTVVIPRRSIKYCWFCRANCSIECSMIRKHSVCRSRISFSSRSWGSVMTQIEMNHKNERIGKAVDTWLGQWTHFQFGFAQRNPLTAILSRWQMGIRIRRLSIVLNRFRFIFVIRAHNTQCSLS